MEFKPHSYQSRAIEHIQHFPRSALFLDMGLGKTVSTLTALSNMIFDTFEILSGSILVIAPLRVAQHTWISEVQKWEHLKHLKLSCVVGSKSKREKALLEKADIYVINRENVPWLVEYLGNDWEFSTIVIDELSSFKNSASKRFKALKRVTPYFERVIGLTGTPAPRGLLDLWAQMYLIDRGERLGRTLSYYRNNYFFPLKQNGYIVYEWTLKENAEEEIYKKLSDICLSMKAVDYLKLPEYIPIYYPVYLKSKMKEYKHFAKNKILELEQTHTAANSGVLCNYLTQFTSGAIYNEDKATYEVIHDEKLEALEDLMESACNNPVLVFYWFKHDKQRIVEKFKDLYTISFLENVEDIEKWNNKQIDMLLVHPSSTGHGLNLQHGGNIIVWFSITWDLELYQQANARLYRQGQKHAVTIYHIVAKDTVDEQIIQRLEHKDITQQELFENIKKEILKHE